MQRKQLSTRDQIRGKSVVWYDYPTHAHNHIKRALAAMDSCFAPLVANQLGIAIARSWYVCFSAFFEHFNQPGHSIADKELIPLELTHFQHVPRKAREAYLMDRGKTLSPDGRNRRNEHFPFILLYNHLPVYYSLVFIIVVNY